jgi:hypothetical protein
MRNDLRSNYRASVACRGAAILEALAIERATLMLQTAWHTPARLLFEEMERFDHYLHAESAAAYRESMASPS